MNEKNGNRRDLSAAASGTVSLGGELTVNRLGFGAMRITGDGIWGPPKDRKQAHRVLRRAIELGVNFFDTADAYGPDTDEAFGHLGFTNVSMWADPRRELGHKIAYIVIIRLAACDLDTFWMLARASSSVTYCFFR